MEGFFHAVKSTNLIRAKCIKETIIGKLRKMITKELKAEEHARTRWRTATMYEEICSKAS